MSITQFPGTNFHDLNLDWLLQEMKNLIAEWLAKQTSLDASIAGIESEWSSTLQAIDGKMTQMDQLYAYIQDYFANLDIQDEVDAAFAEFINSGEFTRLYSATIQTQTATIATAWLNENIVQEQGYVLDPTLTVAAAAAQGEATGIRIREVQKPYYPNNLFYSLTEPFTGGGYTETGKYIRYDLGTASNSQYTIYTGYIDVSGLSSIVYPRIKQTNDPKWGMAYYDAEKNYLGGQRCLINQPSAGYVLTKFDIPTVDANDDPITVKYIRYTMFNPATTSPLYGGWVPLLYNSAEYESKIPGQVAEIVSVDIPALETQMDNATSSINSNTSNISVLKKHARAVDFPGAADFPINAAHRGLASNGYPPNTIVAYKDAISHGWTCLETDIRKTSDGVWVLLHDASINNTARNLDGSTIGSTVNIADITYAQALNYDFGIKYGSQFAGTKIATLDEFIRLCKMNGATPILEVKDSSWSDEIMQTAADIVDKYDMMWRCFWLCSSIGGLHLFINTPKYKHVPLIMTASTDYHWVDPDDFDSVSLSVTGCLTGENKAVYAKIYSGFTSDETHTREQVIDNFIDLCRYKGLLAGTYCPTTEAGLQGLSGRFDMVISQYFKYTEQQTIAVPEDIPE